MRQRWWMCKSGSSEASVSRAIEWLDAVTPRSSPAAILVETASSLRGRDVERVLGRDAIMSLTSQRVHILPSGGRLEALVMRGNRSGFRFDGPLLLVYHDEKLTNFGDSVEGVTEMLVLAWFQKEIDSLYAFLANVSQSLVQD